MEMQIVVNNYGDHDLGWLEGDLVVYDKKDLNVGYNIYDYMDYIVRNYDSLPDAVMFTKGNMLERHITREEFEKVKDNRKFTPLLTQNHKTDGHINYYEDGLYHEKNDSWYLYSYPSKYKSYGDFARDFGLPNPEYLGFAPGGCYIVPRENILKHPKDFYQRLKDLVGYSQINGESHAVERSLYNIWH